MFCPMPDSLDRNFLVPDDSFTGLILPADAKRARVGEDLTSLPRVTEPLMAPPTLEALLAELARAREEGNFQAVSECARDALGFTTRYFAGVVMAASRQLDCLPAQLADSVGTANVEESARKLLLCMERLRKLNSRLSQILTSVFVDHDASYRHFARNLVAESGGFSIVAYCRAPRNVRPSPAELSAALGWLNEWMNSCFGFFLESEQRFDPGAFFGQVEQVVIFEQYILPTGLTLRLKELRQPAPDVTPLVTAADRAAAEQAVDMTLAVAEAPEVTPVPVPESAPEGPVKESPPAPKEAGDLVDFLQLRLNQNAIKSPPQQTPKAPAWLHCDIDPVGLRKNSEGKFGYSGYLWIQLRGESEVEIEGTVSCENPHVVVGSNTFKGVQSRVVFWIDPDEVRTPRGHILIQAHNQERRVPVWKLLPESTLGQFSFTQVLALLLAPTLLGSIYANWVLWSAGRGIEASLHEMLQREFSRFINASNPISLRTAGVGFVDLSLMPKIEASLLIFFCLAWVTPWAVAYIFARLPRHEKKSYALPYVLSLVLPSIYFMALWPSPLLHGLVFRHPDFCFLDFRQHLSHFCMLNLSSAFLAQMWSNGFFHRHLNRLGLVVLGLLTATAFLGCTAVLVYGRSWGWL